MRIATAESCTGGLISAALTDVPGSSVVFDRGYVTYSNEAKIDCLGVSIKSVEEHGAVSEQVAREMADGARRRAGTEIAVSVTGIAGPGGGSPEKPVGLVWFAVATRAGIRTEERRFGESLKRWEIRERTVETALQLVLESFGP